MTGVFFLVDRQEFLTAARWISVLGVVPNFLLTRNTRYDLKIGKQQVAYRAVCQASDAAFQ